MQRLILKFEIKRPLLLIIMFPVVISGQVREDFEQGNLSGWYMDRHGSWNISPGMPLEGSYSLQHVYDNPQHGSDAVWTDISSLQPEYGSCHWQFAIRHGYSPSTENRWMVFLISGSVPDGREPSNTKSIAVTVNHQCSDDLIKLIRIDRSEQRVILNSNVNWEQEIGTTGVALLHIDREPGGIWRMSIREGGQLLGCDSLAVPDPWLPEICFFGLFYAYSSRQDRKLWFDEVLIEGIFVKDTLAPVITGAWHGKGRELLVEFSEAIHPACLQKQNFYLLGKGLYPDSVALTDNGLLYLKYPMEFTDQSINTVMMMNIADRQGNPCDTLYWSFFYHRPKRHDLIINEIMADPSPQVELPDYEYIELLNRSSFEINTSGWAIASGQSVWMLDPVCISPGQYWLVTHVNASGCFPGLDCMNLFTSATSLPNQSSCLLLLDEKGELISRVEYASDWHTDAFRSSGGWSLERIDPERPCGGQENWTTSLDRRGGTPGVRNSVHAVNPDRIPPVVQGLFCTDAHTLQLEFSETMDPVNAFSPDHYRADPGMGNPGRVTGDLLQPGRISLVFEIRLQKGILYELTIKGQSVTDCSGNFLLVSDRLYFGIPGIPSAGDVLINEVLFNPVPYCVDYVELYNNSRKVIDLSDLYITTLDTKTGEIREACRLSEEPLQFLPGCYLVLTRDPGITRNCYHVKDSRALFSLAGLPAMGDRTGHIVLSDRRGETIDELLYSEDMHFDLLYSREGVSLERVSYAAPADDRHNWHSASETSGFGTPGYENSQHVEGQVHEERITISPSSFSPDNDGHQDVLNIRYSFDTPGNVLTVLIFDPRGRLIRRVAGNELAGTEGIITWDGTTNDHRVARTGMYLVLVEVYDAVGNTSRIRKACVLR